MKILIIGSGGREHALVWKLAQSKRVSKIFAAPGNAGISEIAECVPIRSDDVTGLLDFAKKNRIALTVVGPEIPLILGVTDSFKRAGLKIFGPSKEAAVLEGSKSFAKDFCDSYKIPTAASETFHDHESALAYAKMQRLPLVIKADGLAQGKGVIICNDISEVETALDNILTKKVFGDAGRSVVIEEFLEGEEASFIAICDGNHVMPLEGSQDHKRIFDGDRGPNTGGMGAISPAGPITIEMSQTIMDNIMLPAARGMVTEGMPFVGVLYAGLMIKNDEAKVLEFNVRFGDPETEPLLMRLKTDLVDVIEAACTGTLDQISLEWDRRASACVVMSSKGYPGAYEKGKVISGLNEVAKLSDVQVFHAGTKREGDKIVTDGGRVLVVTALGYDVKTAIDRAYEAVEMIKWEGAYCRRDIGNKIVQTGDDNE